MLEWYSLKMNIDFGAATTTMKSSINFFFFLGYFEVNSYISNNTIGLHRSVAFVCVFYNTIQFIYSSVALSLIFKMVWKNTCVFVVEWNENLVWLPLVLTPYIHLLLLTLTVSHFIH